MNLEEEGKKMKQGDARYTNCSEPYLATLVNLRNRFDSTLLVIRAKKF